MKKLVSKRGFTLVEMLIAVMFLGFVTLMAAVMTSVVLNNTVMAKEVAQAEILGSEALDNIQAELRFALKVKLPTEAAAETITFGHDKANENCVLMLDKENGRIILQVNNSNGDGSWTPVSETVFFDGVSYGNLKISDLTFAKDETNEGSIKVTVYIFYDGNELWHGSVSVRPINGVEE